jgi:hypothetical protein
MQLARQAFARRARRVRRAESSVYSVEDLTWALHEIETIEDAGASIEFFRVPANRAALPAPREGDLFFPAPVPIPRRSAPVTGEEIDRLTTTAAAELVDQLVRTSTLMPSDNPYAAP